MDGSTIVLVLCRVLEIGVDLGVPHGRIMERYVTKEPPVPCPLERDSVCTLALCDDHSTRPLYA